MKGPVPPLYAGTVTKYVFVESFRTTPDDLAARAYEVSRKVMIKETCFGMQITGNEEDVDAVISHIRELDPSHIFVKDRGFPPGDPRRCRANLGGARPGYFGHEFEIGLVKWISKGIEEAERADLQAEIPPARSEPLPLDIMQLRKIIDAEVP
jgi:putative methanogenesis marker protein 6